MSIHTPTAAHSLFVRRLRRPLHGVRRHAGWSVLLAALALAGCRSGAASEGQGGPQGQAGGGKPLPVEVMELQPGPVRETGEYLGTLISRSSVTLYPQVGGYVRRIAVRPGEQVKEGQLLLVVDPGREAAGLRGLQAERESARVSRELARRNLQRSESLVREGVVSRQEYEQAVAQAQSAEAAVRAAEAQLQAQQVQLGYFQVNAPFAGVVGDIPVKLGDSVTPQTALTSVDQSRALEVSVAVPVERAGQVKPGSTPVEVLNEEGQPVVSAPVFFVAPNPDARTQLVEVKAAFDNTVGLRAGQVVRARVVYETREALRLPTYAVARQSGQDFALVVVQGDGGGSVVSQRPVKLGEVEGNAFEVKSGLEAGALVAVGSVQMLRDGMPVEPRPASEGAGRREGPGVGGGADAGE